MVVIKITVKNENADIIEILQELKVGQYEIRESQEDLDDGHERKSKGNFLLYESFLILNYLEGNINFQSRPIYNIFDYK